MSSGGDDGGDDDDGIISHLHTHTPSHPPRKKYTRKGFPSLRYIYIYIYILVDPLAGVETNSSLVNWLTGLLVDWLTG